MKHRLVPDRDYNNQEFQKLHSDLVTEKKEGEESKYIIDSFRKYTHPRSEQPLGNCYLYNTHDAVFQLIFTLSLKKEHPMVKDIIDGKVTADVEYVDRMVEANILEGMKIIDLGCGPDHTYANCVKALGADLYTADYNEIRNIEGSKHTRVDFNNPKAPKYLLEKTGGNFDLVTAGTVFTLRTDPTLLEDPKEGRLEAIALELLRPNGIFYYPNNAYEDILVKKEAEE